MGLRARLGVIGVALILAGCTSAPPANPTTSAVEVATPSATAARCGDPSAPLPHQAPELEAVLPTNAGGRGLAVWSIRGRCWLEAAVNLPEPELDDLVTEFETADYPGEINLDHLTYGVAGRIDTKADPPYILFGAGRPTDGDEVSLALFLLFGGATFKDVAAAEDLRNYEERTIGGKQVYVGTIEMLEQTEHQRGRPFLYQTDDFMFIMVSDDDAWANDAIAQLP